MRVLQLTSTDPGGVLGAALSNIHKLAEQVVCYSKDMVNGPQRSDLKRLPAALLVSPLLESLLPHNHEDTQAILHTLANEKGYTIRYNKVIGGPQIIWLQSGSFRTRENQICFCMIIQRPKSTNISLEEGQELASKCSIKTPIAQDQFVNSNFQCRVGDIIILEKGEGLWIDGSIELHGICFVGTLYEIE